MKLKRYIITFLLLTAVGLPTANAQSLGKNINEIGQSTDSLRTELYNAFQFSNKLVKIIDLLEKKAENQSITIEQLNQSYTKILQIAKNENLSNAKKAIQIKKINAKLSRARRNQWIFGSVGFGLGVATTIVAIYAPK